MKTCRPLGLIFMDTYYMNISFHYEYLGVALHDVYTQCYTPTDHIDKLHLDHVFISYADLNFFVYQHYTHTDHTGISRLHVLP